jgi:ADP-ribose pyrophosphatase
MRKSQHMPPSLPEIQLELVEDLSPAAPAGFLRLLRRRFVATYPDGSRSKPFVYDEVDRKAIDAVVIVAHFADALGVRQVYLRSALRPPVVFRDRARSPLPALDPPGSIWELPAGLVETAEQSSYGLRVGALRELFEELGFAGSPDALGELGPSTFPAPGIVAERHFYFEIEVRPEQRQEPELDGSALEREGVVFSLPLAEALAWCRSGEIIDAKTELGLRRLAERFP